MRLPQVWRSSTAVTLAIAMTSSIVLPLTVSRPATARVYQIAQMFPDSWRTPLIPAGTAIPVSYDKEKIVLTPTETVPVTLTVAQDIISSRGRVLIPAGSQIKGNLRPTQDGTQFVAEQITIENRDYSIDATSEIVTRREVITKQSNPRWLEGAAIGGAASAILAEIFGRIDLWEVLGGAGVGALASVLFRGKKEVEVIVVEPATDLELTLQSNFAPN